MEQARQPHHCLLLLLKLNQSHVTAANYLYLSVAVFPYRHALFPSTVASNWITRPLKKQGWVDRCMDKCYWYVSVSLWCLYFSVSCFAFCPQKSYMWHSCGECKQWLAVIILIRKQYINMHDENWVVLQNFAPNFSAQTCVGWLVVWASVPL